MSVEIVLALAKAKKSSAGDSLSHRGFADDEEIFSDGQIPEAAQFVKGNRIFVESFEPRRINFVSDVEGRGDKVPFWR